MFGKVFIVIAVSISCYEYYIPSTLIWHLGPSPLYNLVYFIGQSASKRHLSNPGCMRLVDTWKDYVALIGGCCERLSLIGGYLEWLCCTDRCLERPSFTDGC